MMKKKKRICIVTWLHCLRNIKAVLGAWNLGYELELITRIEGFRLMRDIGFDSIYKSIRIWDSPSQLEAAMRDSKADVFWCHNEPDVMTELACIPSVKRDRIVIHDCHDLPTLHSKATPESLVETSRMEKAAITGADFTFVPTEDYVGLIKAKYGKEQKVKVVYSCPPKIFFPDTDLPAVNGLLYCGQVNVPAMKSRLPYRDMIPLFSMLTAMGVATHIYHTHPAADLMPYTMAGASVYGTMRMYAAIHQYTRYPYGYVGSVMDTPEIQCCMPNKLFDCLAAGIPMIAQNATTAGKWLEDHGVGISIKGMDGLTKVPWGNAGFWNNKRAEARKIRYEFTAESEVRKAFDFVGI